MGKLNIHEGKLDGKGLEIGIVVSRFNEMVTEKLLEGAVDCFKRHNTDEADIHVFRVPGAYEIPAVANKLADRERYDAIVCLGAVIRGDTPHFEMVANETAKGIAKSGMESENPVVFGVLTTDTIEQAFERAGTKAGNRGWDAALSAIEMVNLYDDIDQI